MVNSWKEEIKLGDNVFVAELDNDGMFSVTMYNGEEGTNVYARDVGDLPSRQDYFEGWISDVQYVAEAFLLARQAKEN